MTQVETENNLAQPVALCRGSVTKRDACKCSARAHRPLDSQCNQEAEKEKDRKRDNIRDMLNRVARTGSDFDIDREKSAI